MFKKALFSIIIFCLLSLISSNLPATAKDDFTIKDIKVTNNKIITLCTNNADEISNPKITQLSNPYRLIYDFDNSILATIKWSFDFSGKNVIGVKIAQFSNNPDSVRLVFTANSLEDLKKIKFAKSHDNLIFELNTPAKPKIAILPKNKVVKAICPVKEKILAKEVSIGNLHLTSQHGTPANHKFYPQTELKTLKTLQADSYNDNEENSPDIVSSPKPDMVIDKITYFNNSLMISGNGSMSLKEPFYLQNPDRIVYDIPNSIIASREPYREFLFVNGDKARIGQFDDQTVRVTIETSTPENYKTILSPDSQMLVVKSLKTGILSYVKPPVLKNIAPAVNNTSGFKVVIDAGHGGCDPGAQRIGASEKDITLSVAKKIEENLTNSGVRVIMTRNGDETVSLKERTDITNNENPDVFVSIHVNSSESPNVVGIETHWYTNQSKQLAQIIQDSLSQSINTLNRGIMNSRFYVIHHTEVPSVLVEIGFISNDNDRCQLLSEDRQTATAKAISEGVLQFLNSKYTDQRQSASKSMPRWSE